MKRHTIYFLLLCLLVFGLFGCKSKRVAANNNQLKKKSSKYIFEKAEKYHLDAEWFSAKAALKLKEKNKTIRATAYIRMRKDSVIWMSVKKLGIEGARLQITPDTVVLLNRLEKNYIKQPISYIRDRAGFPGSGSNLEDFQNLYDFILGNIVLKLEGKYKSKTEGSSYHLSKQDETGIASIYEVNGANFTLEKMSLTQNEGSRKAICDYRGYKELANQSIFSYIRKLNLYADETGELVLDLDFSKVELNQPVRMRFSIPEKYVELR